MMCLQLFLTFFKIGCFSVGGGYAAMPLIQSQVVEARGWLTAGEFANLMTISEMTPGPIIVNAATFAGNQLAGIPGAVAATLGSIFPSVLIVSLLAFLYYRYRTLSTLQGVLAGLRPAVVALIAGAGVTLFKTAVLTRAGEGLSKINPVALLSFPVAFLLLRKTKLSPILVMVLCGVVGLLAYMLHL